MIDDNLMAKALAATGLKTKKAVVEEGLRTLVQLRDQGRIHELRGKVHWHGDLNATREGRSVELDE